MIRTFYDGIVHFIQLSRNISYGVFDNFENKKQPTILFVDGTTAFIVFRQIMLLYDEVFFLQWIRDSTICHSKMYDAFVNCTR